MTIASTAMGHVRGIQVDHFAPRAPDIGMALDYSNLPYRLNVKEVCELIGGSVPISRSTLHTRIKNGKVPAPVDRGGPGRLFDRDAVLKALGIGGEAQPDSSDVWKSDPVAYAAAGEAMKPKGAVARPREPIVTESRPLIAGPPPSSDLGPYVVLKRRADGTCRAYFQVPARIRPKGWRPAIRLPLDGPRERDMNPDEHSKIKADAAQLYQSLQRERAAQASWRFVK